MKRAPITALLSRASALLIIRDTNFVEIRVAINFYLHRSCFKPKLQIQKVLLFLMRLHFWKFWGFQFLGSVFGLQPAGLWVGFWWRLASGSLLFAYFAAASLVFFFKNEVSLTLRDQCWVSELKKTFLFALSCRSDHLPPFLYPVAVTNTSYSCATVLLCSLFSVVFIDFIYFHFTYTNT